MRRILLTGASGTVGKEVLRQLCESDVRNEITVFDIKTRSSVRVFRKYRDRINVVFGDISVKNDIYKACSDKDLVIHLAAIIPPLADEDPSLAKAVNIDGTRNLIESLTELSPDTFFVYSSSISVYGDRCRDPWIRVTDPLLPSDRDEYARTKIEAEKLIRNSSLNWSIFRLTAIMGIENHKPSGLMFHMPLDSRMEIATPGDTGRAFINAISRTDVINKNIYNLSGGEKCRISYRDFLSRSFEIFGLGKLDFRENSFAGRNFHCGYYEDGDILNNILDFRRETIDDYFITLDKNISLFRKIPTIMLRKVIKHNLQRKSQPLAAFESKNQTDIRHYF
ncbi:MAG: NAD(P)-dependent oxidoreductase [Bacteroidales bacterium]|jgi:nucleoside-diphosphate-sugar epimerase